MNKKYIYLAGPIFSLTKNEANGWREWIANRLDAVSDGKIIGISPLRCEPLVNRKYELNYNDPKFGFPMAISGKNWFDSCNCDLILAYMPAVMKKKYPSIGTIIEIGWAIAMRKPIILVTNDDHLKNHPIVLSNVNWILDNLEDAVITIEGLFGHYVSQKI